MFGYRGFPGVPLAVQESAGLGVAPHDSLTSSGDVYGVPHSDGWLEPVGVEDSDVLPLHLKHSEPLLASLNLPSNQLITPQIKVLLGKVQKSSMVNEHPSSVAQFKNENYLPFGNQKQGNGDISAQSDVHPQQDSKQKKGKQSIPHVLERIAAPWISPETAQITNSNVKLHNEILEFCWFIEPKEEERLRQKGALEDLLNYVGPLIPKAIIETHGAFGCGLSFAKGPIELVVIDLASSRAELLKSFSRALLNFPTHFCNLTISTGVVGGIKCPMVKFKSVANRVSFEIVFNRRELLKEKECLLENLAEFPDLKYHMYYMIIFLRQRDLDNPIHGGLGVFLLTCMVVGFVKDLHKRNVTARGAVQAKDTLLSEACLRMLEFFGLHFDCSKQKINVSHVGNTIVDKPVPHKDSNFSMTVPAVYGEKDVGLAAHRAKEVYNCLKSRYFFMTNYNYLNGESVLKHLVNPSKVDFMKYLN